MTKQATDKAVRVRFAPSPTGFLHIGSARMALFNWLYARHHKGQFLLRIEDTDRQRSTQDNIDKIYTALQWLGLKWDEEVVLQSDNQARHAEVVQQLLSKGLAYYCYTTTEELEANKKNHEHKKYVSVWRDKDPSEAPAGIKPVVRFKMPHEGVTQLEDRVQGTVHVKNETLEDIVLLRQDGTPTYNLSVVVDDHDMQITHVIRGDDHLTNTFKQILLYQALAWEVPTFAHIPLIHATDGAKLSKRHGAVGVDTYIEKGYLAEALNNYLLRLGWSHGNDEIITIDEAIAWFNLEAIGRSPARFDNQRLLFLNTHYLKLKSTEALIDLLVPQHGQPFTEIEHERLTQGMTGLKERAKTLKDLYKLCQCYVHTPTEFAADLTVNKKLLEDFANALQSFEPFDAETLLAFSRRFAESQSAPLLDLAQPVRIALTGSTVSPSIFEIMAILGKTETMQRITRYLEQ